MRKVSLLFAAFALLFLISPLAAAREHDAYRQVHITPRTYKDVVGVQALGVDFKVLPDGRLEAYVQGGTLERLAEGGFDFEVTIEDMEAFNESRLKAAAVGPSLTTGRLDFPDGSMSGFYTFSEVVQILDDWALQYPDLITPKQSLGKSIQNRDIWAVKISDNPNVDENEPEVYFNSLIHAREPQSMMTIIYYMMHLLEDYGVDPELTYLVDNREIWFVPVHNPDGYVYNEQNYPNGGGMWRKNRRNNGGGSYGVDLNRNYGYKWGYDNYGSSPNPNDETYRGTGPFSEPESQAVRDFILAHPIETTWDTHTYSNLYLCPFGYDNVLPDPADWPIFQEWLADISSENGYPAGPAYSTIGYPVNGATVDWHYATAGNFSIAPEIGNSSDGFWPPKSRIIPLAEENFMPIKYWTWVGGSYVLLKDHLLADDNGDGLYLPGEPVDVTLTLRNKGLAATSTNVVATLSSSSAHVTVIKGTHDFGYIAGTTDADNSGSPLKVKLDSKTPYGEVIALDVDIDFDGFTISLPLSLVCGVPNVIAALDMESDPGWTVGDTGDNATAGIWERDDPIGTSSGGDQIQPENDHTPAPGTQCWVTGNGSSSAGGDDVDNGKTTLKTAVFDLTGVPDAEISYWRWYADLGSSPNNDIFQIDISNDGGANWTNVESQGYTENFWKQVSFVVSDKVAPTANMMMRFIAKDEPNDSLCEACIDDFEIKSYASPMGLALSGPPAVGTTVNIIVDSPDDGGLGYFLAASLGTYPAIPIGSRYFPLQWDFFLQFSLNPANGVFYNFLGTLDGAGHSAAPAFVIPNMPGLIGTEIFTAGLTLDAGYPDGVKNISAPLPIVLQ